jgi:hypothetical protein
MRVRNASSSVRAPDSPDGMSSVDRLLRSKPIDASDQPAGDRSSPGGGCNWPGAGANAACVSSRAPDSPSFFSQALR